MTIYNILKNIFTPDVDIRHFVSMNCKLFMPWMECNKRDFCELCESEILTKGVYIPMDLNELYRLMRKSSCTEIVLTCDGKVIYNGLFGELPSRYLTYEVIGFECDPIYSFYDIYVSKGV